LSVDLIFVELNYTANGTRFITTEKDYSQRKKKLVKMLYYEFRCHYFDLCKKAVQFI